MIPNRENASSRLSGAKGWTETSATMASACRTPAAAIRSRARAIDGSETSAPSTRPPGPTRVASSRTVVPAPQPMSSTRSPGRGADKANSSFVRAATARGWCPSRAPSTGCRLNSYLSGMSRCRRFAPWRRNVGFGASSPIRRVVGDRLQSADSGRCVTGGRRREVPDIADLGPDQYVVGDVPYPDSSAQKVRRHSITSP